MISTKRARLGRRLGLVSCHHLPTAYPLFSFFYFYADIVIQVGCVILLPYIEVVKRKKCAEVNFVR